MTAISLEQLQVMLEELDQGSFTIINEEDREFVVYVKMLRDLQQPVPQSAAQRIHKIYQEFKKNMHDVL